MTTGDEDGWRRSAVVAVTQSGGFPSLAARSLDQIRDFGGELGSGEPRAQSRRLSPIFITQYDRGPLAIVG